MCEYLPHINRLFVVFTHCTQRCSRNTTVSQLHATDAFVPLARSFVLGPGVTGACDVVSMTSPYPRARLSHHPLLSV
jgi:hypothetical protein